MPPTTLTDLFPELFFELASHLPLSYHASSMLSLSLVCRRIHHIVVPNILYRCIRLVGEDNAVECMNMLLAKPNVETTSARDVQSKGYGRFVRDLCLSSSTGGLSCPYSLDVLERLINTDSLPNITSLTLRVEGVQENGLNGCRTLPKRSFSKSLVEKCPNLITVDLGNFVKLSLGDGCHLLSDMLSMKKLSSLRVPNIQSFNGKITPDLSHLSQNLHTLELRVNPIMSQSDFKLEASGRGGLFECNLPHLRTLVLDHVMMSDALSANKFWLAHPGIERLELGRQVDGPWVELFPKDALPGLKYLQCNFDAARAILPIVHSHIVIFNVFGTFGSQAVYLMREAVRYGAFLNLRSLAVEMHPIFGFENQMIEGAFWTEPDDGVFSECEPRLETPQNMNFDANYVLSISKAAPNLEELSLFGRSNDSTKSFMNALSRLPTIKDVTLCNSLRTLGRRPFCVRSTLWIQRPPVSFFIGNHEGVSKNEIDWSGLYEYGNIERLAVDLANTCRRLETVTMASGNGEHSMYRVSTMKIQRDRHSGACLGVEIRKRPMWGNVMGKEGEWNHNF